MRAAFHQVPTSGDGLIAPHDAARTIADQVVSGEQPRTQRLHVAQHLGGFSPIGGVGGESFGFGAHSLLSARGRRR